MKQALREHTLTVDVANGRVVVSPPPTYDITDPGDDIPTPSWWKSRVVVDGSVVRLKMVAAHLVLVCGAGVDNYTLSGGTQGVSDVLDVDGTRVGQFTVLSGTLPSTNGREYAVELVSYTGDARPLRAIQPGFAAPSGVTNVPFTLQRTDNSVLVAPTVGATYVLNVLFWQTS